LETSGTTDLNTSSTNHVGKRTASMISLTLNDFLSPSNDQSISTISGTYVSQPSIPRTLPSRRLRIDRRHQQQQQNTTLNGNETDQMPNLMELATSKSSRLSHASLMNNVDTSTMDSSNKYSYDTQTDSNGISHHRLYTVPDNVLSPLAKNETAILRTSVGLGTKMPPVMNSIGNLRRTSTQKSINYISQQILAPIEPSLKERSILITKENIYQPNPMERVNQIIQQLHLPSEKHKRS
jgi:hypothetical protein